MDKIYIPDEINKYVMGLPYSVDDIGMSNSRVLVFDDMVLKIEKNNSSFASTVEMMKWLDGKIPAPRVICAYKEDGLCYLLMTKVKGEMSCEEYYLEHPNELCEHLANGLRMLWSVDISDCPRIRDLDTELNEARYRVDNKLYDLSDSEKGTFGENGRFENPEALLNWLYENKPKYEPVLSHGDYCLPNVFINEGKISGFIDLGDTGIGDKWRDIALCYRSLIHNFDGTFGGKVYENFSPELLFEKLGIEPNRKKLEYYILLDELF